MVLDLRDPRIVLSNLYTLELTNSLELFREIFQNVST